MREMKRFAILIALALLLAACGGGVENDHEQLSGALATPQPALVAAGIATPDSGAATHCGKERWPVKTLADTDAGRVNFTPQQTTVDALRALSPPGSLPQANRITPTELTTYTITATLVGAGLEADSDIHLVVADPESHATLIVEFPDAAHCVTGADPAVTLKLGLARKAFVGTEGMPKGYPSPFMRLHGTAVITGVGFFDVIHGQRGVAPNGIELHPVLSFQVQ